MFLFLNLLVNFYFLVAVSYSEINAENLPCQLTTNIGNISNAVANLQDTLALNCSGINENVTKFEWKKDGTLQNTSLSIFTKNNVSQSDAGWYECSLVQDSQRKLSCSVFVKVNSAPKITQLDHYGGERLPDSEIEITCVATGFPRPNFTWNIPNIRIKHRNDTAVTPMKYSSKIILEYPKSVKIYTCNAKNKYGKTNHSTSYDDPNDSKCPGINSPGKTYITIEAGKSFTLLCVMKHPNKNHGFYNIFPTINDKNHIYIIDKETKTVNYTVVSATTKDSGIYKCSYNRTKNQSKCGRPSNKIFYVSIKGPNIAPLYVSIAVSSSGAVIGLALVFGLAYYLFKSNKMKSQRFYDSLPELRWDVFVSYSSKDFTWVKELCETLEQPPFNLIVCLHQRDWEIGRTVMDNMADSVYCSFKTLLIVSKHYLQSTYCMQELELAVNCESGTRNQQRDKILLIKIDNVSLKSLPKCLRQKSYLDFSNGEERKHYKKKLLKALPRRDTKTDEENNISGNCNKFTMENIESDQITTIT